MLAADCRCLSENEGDGIKMEFVRIPAGSFYMGSPYSEKGRDDNEGPVHEVRITKPFYMGKYEVTQGQWKAVMGTTVGQQRDKVVTPWNLKGEGPEHPIYCVSWEEAVEFCSRLGRKFRLPTEAEWEYACRAGSRTRFHYCDDPNYSELGQYAWYWGKSDNKTHPVGQKKPNAWSLYDMYGNLSEWCSDLYSFGRGYKDAQNVGPRKPASGPKYHVIRGGSWLGKPQDCRSASRRYASRGDSVGLRVVFAGKIRGDDELLEIALPQKTAKVVSAPGHVRDKWPIDGWLVAGVVRDETGMSVDGIDIDMLLANGSLRKYAEGEFEVYWFPKRSETSAPKLRLVARQMQRNLVAVTEIDKDTKTLEVRSSSGVILTGKVVGSDGEGVKGAKIIAKLRDPDWNAAPWSAVVETDAAGEFEIRALPLSHTYALSARKLGYLTGRIEVRSADMHDNRVDGVSIVLSRGQFSVSGVVVDVNGKPVPGAWVFCTGEGQAGINSHTDANGNFKAEGIFEGQVQITAALRGILGWDPYGSVNAEAGATDIKIVLDNKGALPPKGRACFPGETGVWINGTVVQISKVARGQTVGKHGCAVPTAAFGQVENIEEHTGTFKCRDIMLDSGNHISVVDAHCFMLDSGRWIAAQDLRSGMRLKTLNGTVRIKSVTTRATPFVGKVYNLKIQSSDRYMVGKDGVIVRDY